MVRPPSGKGSAGSAPMCSRRGAAGQHRSALHPSQPVSLGRYHRLMRSPPRILVTTHGPAQAALEEPTWKTFARYVEGGRRAGVDAVLIDAQAPVRERAGAFAVMDGLLLPGGADLDPARYGQPPHSMTVTEAGRDELE